MPLAKNISDLRRSVEEAARKAGRRPEEIQILLVTKTVEPERIREAVNLGFRDFGENRIQEWRKKREYLPRNLRWHLIGHLQRNKVKDAAGEFFLIHSLDRQELAAALEKEALRKNIRSVDCLIQVNMTGETAKSGFRPEAVRPFLDTLRTESPVKIRGLMTIGPLEGGEGAARAAFRQMRELGEALKREFPERDWGILSMGMSGDYRIAIEEGANLIRIGTAVFGERKESPES